MSRNILIVGAGPGLGASVAHRFATEGCSVALFARSEDPLSALATDVNTATPGDALAVPTDITDPEQVAMGVERVRDAFGPVDAVISTVYSDVDNDGVPSVDTLRETAAVELDGVLRCVNEVLPDLRAADRADVLVTGSASAVRSTGSDPARAAARAGRRALLKSIADEFATDGIHVAHLVVDGWLDTPALRDAHPGRREDAWVDTNAVADAFWRLATQPPRAWTFELDIRASADGVDT